MASADLLLHPVRLRIVQAFLGDRALTTTALKSELPEVPAGSLYWHVARLVDGGVLAVVSGRRVRGALERTCVLRASAAHLSLDEIAKMTPDEHRQAFLAFVAGLIGDADRYLARDDIDPSATALAATWPRCGSTTPNSPSSSANLSLSSNPARQPPEARPHATDLRGRPATRGRPDAP